MKPYLPNHRKGSFLENLASTPAYQKHLSITKWNKVLGELRSMSLIIPGLQGLFSHMQEYPHRV